MYNVKAAVSRLEFGPKPKEMEVTDIRTGHFVFQPVEGEEVSFAALDEAIVDAGYEIESATIEVSGTLTENRHLEIPGGQIFHLDAGSAGGPLQERLAELEVSSRLTVAGAWKAMDGVEAVEVTEIRDDGTGGEE